MNALAKTGVHPRCQRDGVLSEFLAQLVSHRQRPVPSVVRALAFKAELLALWVEVGHMDTEKPHRGSIPICTKEFVDCREHFRIDRRRLLQRTRAGNRMEGRIAQLQLQ